jgi:hypothetical protein
METTTWMIRVQGYGTFEFEGTEHEAEEMRKHKAQWERGLAMKWRKDLSRESDRISAVIADQFDQGNGVPGSLVKRRAQALKAEAIHAD